MRKKCLALLTAFMLLVASWPAAWGEINPGGEGNAGTSGFVTPTPPIPRSPSASEIDPTAIPDPFRIEEGVLLEYLGDAERVVIPSDVHTIGAKAFENHPHLKTLVLGEEVRLIKDSAFIHCLKLEKVIPNEKLEEIETKAFAQCPNLDITFADDIEDIKIAADAFLESGTELPTPTVEPTEVPTVTLEPTEAPTPTAEPTEAPTPTMEPTETPTPTVEPTEAPTPTAEPTEAPTPTVEPTEVPTVTTEPTEAPTPTLEPTEAPTPTVEPTEAPTPTTEPTEAPPPTVEPTEVPTPTAEPTEVPTPTVEPTEAPTVTLEPTEAPTPTTEPTEAPTPTVEPTEVPTVTTEPTEAPTPTVEPTEVPTVTTEPTEAPTPTTEPTEAPTPTVAPSDEDFIIAAGVLIHYSGTAETVIIPDSVHTIGINAFADNAHIKTVIFGSNVSIVSATAFARCINLEKVVPNDLLYWIDLCSFAWCPKLDVTFADHVPFVSSDAFLESGQDAATPTPEPTATATPEPTATATPEPTVTATPEPTVTATPEPTVTATPEPTETATPEPTETATPEPTVTATPEPTVTATPEPTETATPEPTETATPEPTETATPEPTETATPEPTSTVTPEPTETATPEPTESPTPEPTETATPESTSTVTPEPTETATPEPTETATPEPTPTVTPEPTETATPEPTVTATPEPTPTVTPEPTETATPEPTPTVTPEPTETATPEPSPTVTPEPTETATPEPTETATPEPTPTVTPEPTVTATPVPTETATPEPTPSPTPVPSLYEVYWAEIADLTVQDEQGADISEAGADLIQRIQISCEAGDLNAEERDTLLELLAALLAPDESVSEVANGTNWIALKNSGWFEEYSHAGTLSADAPIFAANATVDTVAPIAAAPADTSPSAQQIDNPGGTNHGDKVSVSKTIRGTELENVFDITLTVQTQQKIEEVYSDPNMAVVIVMDISNTMTDDFDGVTRYAAAMEAADDFLDQFSKHSSGVSKVGYVAFNTDAHQIFGLSECQNTEQANALKNMMRSRTGPIINQTNYKDTHNRFTNVEAGLKMGYDMLKDTKQEYKYIILLTDGFPTTYVKSGYSGYDPYTPSGTVGQDGVFYDAVFKKYCSYGTSYSDKAAIRARKQAAYIKNNGVTIFSIGVDVDGQTIQTHINNSYGKGHSIVDRTGTTYEIGDATSTQSYKNWLRDKIGSGYYYDSTNAEGLKDAYTAIFSKIKETIEAASKADWVAEDPVPSSVGADTGVVEFIGFYDKNAQLVSGDLTNPPPDENTATFDSAKSAINWDLKNSAYTTATEGKTTTYTYTLKYRVRLENEQAGFVENEVYNTNGNTTLTYRVMEENNGQTTISEKRTIEFPIPAVHGYLGELTFTKIDNYDRPVTGAEFTLTHSADCLICKGNNEMQPKPSSTRVEDVMTQTATSDENGTVSFTRIPSGHHYLLQETHVPDGYLSFGYTYTVYVNFDKVNVVANGSAPAWDYTYVNHTGVELPATSGSGTRPYLLGGMLLCSLACLVTFQRKKGVRTHP